MPAVPLLKPREVVKTFEKLGWEVVRQRGSHIILTKEGQIATLWEWALHEDNLFVGRINFFIVAESIQFSAFATLVPSGSTNSKILRYWH